MATSPTVDANARSRVAKTLRTGRRTRRRASGAISPRAFGHGKRLTVIMPGASEVGPDTHKWQPRPASNVTLVATVPHYRSPCELHAR